MIPFFECSVTQMLVLVLVVPIRDYCAVALPNAIAEPGMYTQVISNAKHTKLRMEIMKISLVGRIFLVYSVQLVVLSYLVLIVRFSDGMKIFHFVVSEFSIPSFVIHFQRMLRKTCRN